MASEFTSVELKIGQGSSYDPRDAAMRPSRRTSMMRRAFLGATVVGATLVAVVGLLASGAQAQARKKITLDDLVIEGNIQKPEAFFILPRTNLNFADLERREDLKSRIIKSVEKEPF
jgi:hypothetical protein